MRNLRRTFLIATAIFVLFITNASAQDEPVKEETTSPFSIGVDVVTNYVWRGSKFGTGPALQPTVKYTIGGFSAGVWGSFDAAGYQEVDPFITYTAPFGLTLGAYDYYYPTQDLFNVSDTAGSHGLELTAGYTIKGFSLSANYIVNEAPGAGTKGGDTYIQAGYAFKYFNVFIGAGNGWYIPTNIGTDENEFKICNIGIGATKEIKITDNFKIPVFGQIIVNPDQERLFLVVGLSF